MGHRSQAPPEVRHISGQHVKEFRDFLARHTDDFVVRDDDVIYLKKYEGCLSNSVSDSSGKTTIEPTPKIDPQVTQQLLSTIREHLEHNPKEEILLEDLYQEITPTLSQMPIKKYQDLATFLRMHSHLFRLNGGHVSLIPISNLSHLTSTPERKVQSSGTMNGDHSNSANQLSVTVSNNISMNNTPQENKSLKQRVESVVMKALADNSDRNSRSSPIGGSSSINEDKSGTGILQRSKVITNAKECCEFLEECMRRGEPIAIDCEGLNLSSSQGQVTLVQLGSISGQATLLDVLCDPLMWTTGKLKDLLESSDVVKVLHDCRNISSVLHAQHGINLNQVFDAQVKSDSYKYLVTRPLSASLK